MSRLIAAGALVVVLVPRISHGQAAPLPHVAEAIRVDDGAIVVDGLLDDEAWRNAPPLLEFVQKEPVEGAAPTDRLEVRFAYDNNALFVAARMYGDPAALQAPMSRRDNGATEAEHILIELDSYLDRRTAYAFGVTASGVRLDHYHGADRESDPDLGFDPVWEARTQVVEDGWTAELWIPLSQIRFNLRGQQVWGLNVSRWVPSRNESVYWMAVGRTEQGWSSRFGELRGLTDLSPPRRFELMPYVSASTRLTGRPDTRNPFDDGTNLAARVGADVKVGFGSNLTLDATVNPDFGQVEADPSEVNLSVFETVFTEKRPFFVEGAGVFSSRFGTYFYSRRVGAPPAGSASGDFTDSPTTSTILGAAKLAGRLSSKTTIGVLGAVTAPEEARTFSLDSATRDRVRVAAASTYGVARVLQEFGASASTAGFMLTAVHRDLDPGGPLATLQVRNALTLSGDSVLRLKGGEYELALGGGLTYLQGSAAAIDRVQRSSARYFQRPDHDFVRYDPTRTAMTGAKADLSFERRSGRHWIFYASVGSESPEFENNDLGRIGASDGIYTYNNLRYRETTPNRLFRSYAFQIEHQNEWNYGGDPQSAYRAAYVDVVWANFWTTVFRIVNDGSFLDERLTRGGPLMATPADWIWQVDLSTNRAVARQANATVQYGYDENGGQLVRANAGLSLRPSPRWQLSVRPSFERRLFSQQYVTTLDGGRAETFGKRYIFAFIDRATWSTQFRLNYTIRPDLTIDVYAEPFAASGVFSRFGELAAPRSRRLLPTAPLPNRDFVARSFRSNVVLRWEWRPGSTFYAVWQQNRAGGGAPGSRATAGDMFESLTAPGSHVLAVKSSLWLSRR